MNLGGSGQVRDVNVRNISKSGIIKSLPCSYIYMSIFTRVYKLSACRSAAAAAERIEVRMALVV